MLTMSISVFIITMPVPVYSVCTVPIYNHHLKNVKATAVQVKSTTVNKPITKYSSAFIINLQLAWNTNREHQTSHLTFWTYISRLINFKGPLSKIFFRNIFRILIHKIYGLWVLVDFLNIMKIII